MTNTETPTAPRLSEFAKAAALVEVERVGFYTGPVNAAMSAGLDGGFLETYVLTGDEPMVALRLTSDGRGRLAGFRALLGV